MPKSDKRIIEHLRQPLQMLRLCTVEADWEDELLQTLPRNTVQVRRPLDRLEQALRDLSRRLILCSRTEDRGHKYAEWVCCARSNKIDDRRTMPFVFRLQDPRECWNVVLFHRVSMPVFRIWECAPFSTPETVSMQAYHAESGRPRSSPVYCLLSTV